MKEYLIEDYTNVKVDAKKEPHLQTRGEPKLKVVNEEKLWEIIQSLKDKPRKIAVTLLGDCILDWS